MDTNSLIITSMGVSLIAVGVPLLVLARYLLAPEDNKKRMARGIKVTAIIWIIAGLLIYLRVLLLILFR